MHYDAIIFDWDGTIGMTLHLWLEGYHHGLKDQGHHFDDQTIMENFFNEHQIAKQKYPHIDIVKMADHARDFVHDNMGQLALYPQARETLDGLAERGTAMALVSSSPRVLIDKALQLLDMGRYFQSVLAGDDVTHRKPNPESFLTSLQRLGVAAEQTLIIGDAPSDIVAGKAAKTRTCLFVPEENRPFYNFDHLQKSQPDYSIPALKNLLPQAQP